MEDVKISLAYDEKDGRWRWLTEQGDWSKAGEEYALETAIAMATQAVLYRAR